MKFVSDKARERIEAAKANQAQAMAEIRAAKEELRRQRPKPLTEGQIALKEFGGTFAREVVCQFCGTRGQVHFKTATTKAGVSGGKATGAVFTAGFSMLATGLSRKKEVSRFLCGHCGMSWSVDR